MSGGHRWCDENYPSNIHVRLKQLFWGWAYINFTGERKTIFLKYPFKIICILQSFNYNIKNFTLLILYLRIHVVDPAYV